MTRSDYQKVFILNGIGIGDLMFALPFLHTLRKNLPFSEIILAASKRQIPIAEQLLGKVVDGIQMRYYDNRLIDTAYWLLQNSKINPDLFIEFSGGYRYAITGRFSPAAKVLHPPDEYAKKLAQFFYEESVPKTKAHHRVDIYLSYIDNLGMQRNGTSFEFPVPASTEQQATKLMEMYDMYGFRFIALVPKSSEEWKNWPAQTLNETVDRLTRDMGQKVLILGKDPNPNLHNKNVLDLGGKTNLLLDAYLARYSGLIDISIGVDTGMMHIVGSVSSNPNGIYEGVSGNKTISLFGATDPLMYGPYDPTGRFNLVVHPNLDEVKRDFLGYAVDKHRRDYMKEITAKMILEKVEKHLGSKFHV